LCNTVNAFISLKGKIRLSKNS